MIVIKLVFTGNVSETRIWRWLSWILGQTRSSAAMLRKGLEPRELDEVICGVSQIRMARANNHGVLVTLRRILRRFVEDSGERVGTSSA